jgi:hypothetical protein
LLDAADKLSTGFAFLSTGFAEKANGFTSIKMGRLTTVYYPRSVFISFAAVPPTPAVQHKLPANCSTKLLQPYVDMGLLRCQLCTVNIIDSPNPVSMYELLNNFKRYTDGQLELTLQEICVAMKDNPLFPAPHPELTATITATADYVAALAAARTGDRTAIAVKNQKKAEAVAAAFALGNYVANLAGDNLAIIAASSFRPRKQPGNLPPISQPEINSLEPGMNEGEITVVVNRMPGARWYRFECSQDPNATTWLSLESTKSKLPFTGLESGKVYHFRVTVYGINGQQATSNVVTRRVY